MIIFCKNRILKAATTFRIILPFGGITLENYEHHITKSIRSLYKKRLPAPLIYLALLIFIWFYFNISSVVFHLKTGTSDSFELLYDRHHHYIQTTLSELYFTGYTQSEFGHNSGYYYYTMRDGECLIVLLSPSTCEEGLPEIKEATVTARILRGTSSYERLLDHLSDDLGWTDDGIRVELSDYYLSEPDFKPVTNNILLIFLTLSGLYAAFSALSFLLYLAVPYLAPPCRSLTPFGRPKDLLALAEEELATLPQLATEDMFITEHFFIETSNYGIAIVPIKEIVWIYKHSTLHKVFWYHFSISYTLHITATHHVYIQCPKNIKSDIDGIIDYLAEANHDILVGFNEENRRKVQKIQGNPLQMEKFIALLKKKF